MCAHLRSHNHGQVCFIAKFCNFCSKLSHWFVFSCVILSVYQKYSIYLSLLYLVAGEILLNQREIEITVIKKFRGFLHCRLVVIPADCNFLYIVRTNHSACFEIILHLQWLVWHAASTGFMDIEFSLKRENIVVIIIELTVCYGSWYQITEPRVH